MYIFIEYLSEGVHRKALSDFRGTALTPDSFPSRTADTKPWAGCTPGCQKKRLGREGCSASPAPNFSFTFPGG